MDTPSPLDQLDPNVPSRQLSRNSQLQKPLPPAPPPLDRTASEAPLASSAATAFETPSHMVRPSSSGSNSVQRPRKRTIWHNKACWIALPIDNEFGKKTTRESFLGFEDVNQLLQDWANRGYDTRGFLLANPLPGFALSGGESQSREIHPSLEDVMQEHVEQPYRVSIPDRSEWEAYVNQLKEEKLLALGVTFGDEGPPRKSPVSSLMSRQASSQSSAMLTSPALAPQSLHGMQFPPGLPSGPIAMPHIGNPSVSHFPRYSIASPVEDNPFPPSNRFSRPPAQPPVYGPWPTQHFSGSRPGSRVTSPKVDGLGATLDGINPSVTPPKQTASGQLPSLDSNDLLSRMRRQQALLQAQQLHQQHQQHQQMARAHMQIAADSQSKLELKPCLDVSPNYPEIASPAPCNHHQKNPSKSMEKELDGAENFAGELGEKIVAKQSIVDEEDRDFGIVNDVATPKPSQQGDVLDDKLEVSDAENNRNRPGTPTVRSDHLNSAQRENTHKAFTSKLNVNAPEFKYEPRQMAEPGVFAFRGDLQPARARGTIDHPVEPAADQPELTRAGPAQGTKFNVEAPEFTPGAAARKPSMPSREFSFSASLPSFRPDAPAFKPNDRPPAPVSDVSDKERPPKTGSKIFGEIKFPDVIKPAKRSKAVPIIKPNRGSESSQESVPESDGQEDESGRITQADGRQKRVRRDLDHGDQVPRFASPNQAPWINQEADDRASYFSSTPSPQSEKAEATTLEAATDLLEEIIDDLSATETSDIMREDDSLSGDGKIYKPHGFDDVGDAAIFDAARPNPILREQSSHHLDPTEEDVTKATVDFLDKSPHFRANVNQILETHNPNQRSIHSGDYAFKDGVNRIDHARQDIMNGVRYVEPSYDELDAIVKHLNEDLDHGVRRRPSPSRHRGKSISPVRSTAPQYNHISSSPVRDSTRELYEESKTPQLLNAPHFRSDAPSPSPNRLYGTTQYLPQTDSESINTSAIETIDQISREIANNPLNSPSWPAKNAIPVHQLNSPGSTPPSDWNDAISSLDEGKFHSRTGFFDTRVNDLVGSVVQQRLGPLEKALTGIQKSLMTMASRSGSRGPRSSGTLAIVDSDADDEEDCEGSPQKRMKSPLRDRKYEQLKSTLNDLAAAQKDIVPVTQIEEIARAVKDLKASIPQGPPPPPADASDIRNIVEEAIGKQMRGRSAPVTSSSVAAAAEKSQLQIAGLESMLKVAEGRADHELKARRSTEDALADSQRLLRSALQEAAGQRESTEATERTLEEYSEERQEMLQRTAILERSEQNLQRTISDLVDKNFALEGTLAEYRLSSDQWRTEIDDARHENKDLWRSINSLKTEIDEGNESRQALREKFTILQEETNHASQEGAAEYLRWQTKEQEHTTRLEMLSARLEAEARTRERLELEIERLETQEKEGLQSRLVLEQTQKAKVQLQNLVTDLRSECHEHQKAASRLGIELHNAKESSIIEIRRTRVVLEADINAAQKEVQSVMVNLEAAQAQFQRQKESIETDAADAGARFKLVLEEATKSRHAALEEAAATKEIALQKQTRSHEMEIQEIKVLHERVLRNALEDKERSETYTGNRLSLAEEKITHYRDRITHLEERLEIAKSAAHAAVQSAQNSRNSIATSSGRALHTINKDSQIPEKVSPQALRESILVLQEQLQQRESRIEQLETELSAVDITAPAKLKDAEVEITWLRELLGVRIDDLEDVITTLSQPLYDREAVKDAVIRLKANLQMEQQEKERAMAGGQTFPSLASISNLAASPKALPLAAAAAWGNWRKGRDGFGNLNAVANGAAQQTPSKSSPQSFFAGLMTPPSTNLRNTPPLDDNSRPQSSSSSSLKRAVRSPATPRQCSSARSDMRLQQDPVTPPLMRKTSYDLDANENIAGFGDEGVEGSRMATDDEEPFGPRLGGIVGTM